MIVLLIYYSGRNVYEKKTKRMQTIIANKIIDKNCYIFETFYNICHVILYNKYSACVYVHRVIIVSAYQSENCIFYF